MATIVEKAIRGHKKSMQALYESNITSVHTFCRTVIDNAQKADLATANIFYDIWSRLKNKPFKTEEEFSSFVMQYTARYCRTLLFKGDTRIYKLQKPKTEVLWKEDDAPFDADVVSGYAFLETALEQLDAYQRFAVLLRFAGGFTDAQIGQVLKIREPIAAAYTSAAAAVLDRRLTKMRAENNDAGIPSVGQLPSLMEQLRAGDSIPESVDARCRSGIERNAVSKRPRKKHYIVAACLACLCIAAGILIFVACGGNSDNAESERTSTGNDDYSDAETENTDQTANGTMYYADIDIADYGVITVALDSNAAPITVENFISLAESGFYDGLTFHRIMEGFMMQGGDPSGDGTGGSAQTIVGEFTNNGYENNLSHTRGAISMARSSDYDSASSQFFIVQEDSTYLDGDYAVFGYVTEGMDIVDRICQDAEPTDDNGTIPAEEQPVIASITIRTDEPQDAYASE